MFDGPGSLGFQKGYRAPRRAGSSILPDGSVGSLLLGLAWFFFFKCNNFCIIVIFTFTIQNVELLSAHTIDQCHSLGKNQHHCGVLSHHWKGKATQKDVVMNLLQRKWASVPLAPTLKLRVRSRRAEKQERGSTHTSASLSFPISNMKTCVSE